MRKSDLGGANLRVEHVSRFAFAKNTSNPTTEGTGRFLAHTTLCVASGYSIIVLFHNVSDVLKHVFKAWEEDNTEDDRVARASGALAEATDASRSAALDPTWPPWKHHCGTLLRKVEHIKLLYKGCACSAIF